VARREEGEQQGYLTDEQRSHAGWIGASKQEVICERALSPVAPAPAKISAAGLASIDIPGIDNRSVVWEIFYLVL
jgi:hypothetical protein